MGSRGFLEGRMLHGSVDRAFVTSDDFVVPIEVEFVQHLC